MLFYEYFHGDNGAGLGVLQLERMTKNEKEVIDKLHELHIDPNPPEEWISLSVDREVLKES